MAVSWPEEIAGVYVLCHPTKEKARWDRLLPHLLSRGIPANKIFISAATWGTDLTPDLIFKIYDPFLKRGPLPGFSFKSAGLTKGEISLTLNFATAVIDIAKKKEHISQVAAEAKKKEHISQAATEAKKKEYFLVFESDVWLREDFLQRLHDLLKEAEGKPWDYISLGEGVGTRPPEVSKGNPFPSYYSATKLYKPPHDWSFRCTDSMLFTREFIEKISKTIIPFKEATDWEMNFQLSFLHRGNALWADPPLAEQGTLYNRLVTNLAS